MSRPVAGCWLVRNGHMEDGGRMGLCEGRLIKAHLISRQVLIRELGGVTGRAAILDPRSWVWACGGIMGVSGHHGAFDSSKRLRVRRDRLPPGVEDLAEELDLVWWLDRTFGR